MRPILSTCCLAPLLLAALPAQAPATETAPQRARPYALLPPRAWLHAVEQGTRSSDGLPGKDHWTSFAHYVVQAELEPATATVHGHARMTFDNRSPQVLQDLVVYLRQNLHRPDAIRNTAVAITGGMTIEHLTVDGSDLAKNAYHAAGTTLDVHLPHRVEHGESVTLAMDFAFVVPPAGGAPRMGQEDHHVFYLGYWYPQFAVYDDVGGWVAEPYLGTSEFYMDYADYDVSLTAPVNWLVRATGELVNEKEVLTDAERVALAKAATAEAVVHVLTAADVQQGKVTRAAESGKLTWHFQARNVRDFAVSASDRYVWDATHAVVKDRDGKGKDGTCMIHAVYRPQARPWIDVAKYERHAIEYVSANVFPYPWPHMTACEGVIDGGMEYPMMTLIGNMGGARTQEAVTAHELIHMWFPMLVGSNETAHAWQDEGFADFITDYVTADAWQQNDPGAATLEQYAGMAQMLPGEEPVMTHGDHFESDMDYEFCSYTKPAAMLHQLVGMCGHDAVFAALRTYAEAWQYRHPLPYDFFRHMDAALGQDLGWYWREWCFDTWRLDTSIAKVESDARGTKVIVEDLGQAMMPTLVQAKFADGHVDAKTVDVQWWLQGHRQATVEFAPGVIAVEIDPRHVTMDIDRSNNIWTK
jgi:Peptidase family M1 domain